MTGLLSLKEGTTYYTLHFLNQGWLSADMVQYLDDILGSANRPAQILKLLGLTMTVTQKKPARRAEHWVIVDLNERSLETNSEWIRKAVDRVSPDADSRLSEGALRRIHEVLDRHDFTVTFFT